MPEKNTKLDQLCIDAIRVLSMDAVQKADSGHPGTPMALAPLAYVLWTRHLRYNPANPQWVDRDRFVLSAGHASMLLYSVLYLTGYEVSLDDIKHFRQWESSTPGHPEYGDTDGVEATTGPLGQGLSMAVGMAIAEKHLAAVYNRPGFEVVDHDSERLAVRRALGLEGLAQRLPRVRERGRADEHLRLTDPADRVGVEDEGRPDDVLLGEGRQLRR